MHRRQGATAPPRHGGVRGQRPVRARDRAAVDGGNHERRLGCDACGTRTVGHGPRDVRVRDRPSAITWWSWCGACGCGAASIRIARSHVVRETDAIAPRRVLKPSGPGLGSVAGSDVTVTPWRRGPVTSACPGTRPRESVRDHGRPRVDHPSRPRMPSAIGIEETAFMAANASHRNPDSSPASSISTDIG